MSISTLHRHPNPLEIIALCKEGAPQGIRLSPPPGKQALSRMDDIGWTFQEMRQASASDILLSSDMGAMLAPIFGSPDTVVPGKHRDAEVFGFEANGEVVVAITESGDGGSAWFWFPHKALSKSPDIDADDPLVAHFWPDFVDGLMSALGRPFSHPHLTFLPHSSPMARRLANQIASSLSSNESCPFPKRPTHRL